MYVQLRSKMVKGVREERSWTQRDLADKAGVSVSTVKNGERGRPVQVKTARIGCISAQKVGVGGKPPWRGGVAQPTQKLGLPVVMVGERPGPFGVSALFVLAEDVPYGGCADPGRGVL